MLSYSQSRCVRNTAMSNLSELDGEVDHSYFDSDCDDSSNSKDVGNTSDKVLTDSSSESEEDIHLCSQRPNRTSSSLSGESKEGDYSGGDSKSSCSSVQERSSSESSTLPRPKKTSLSPGGRRTQMGLGGTPGGPVYQTEESEDTVTDVSPLSSPDFSPRQSLEANPREDEERTLTEQQQQQEEEEESVPSSGLSSAQQDEDSDQDSDSCFLGSGSQFGGGLVFHKYRGSRRKNYSFTNDQVRGIDRENQRLLRELSRFTAGPRPGSAAGKKTHTAMNSQLVRPSHSALNRQRGQQRIARENLAILKRLESVKVTPGLKRSQQLEDYQRLTSYQRNPSYPVCLSTTKERSSSKTPSGPRPISSVHHSPRSVSTSPDSRNTPTVRSKKTSAARPAWC
ncbi:cilia- and flagella-associated protein 97 [Xyrichtys novacula]|uniref:Cilia- and flagella-associated protein 97 n=1 Tax=Xyrichtys novacula TaxID=13765 RepID=A0AAV1EU30_XYRNO|nr:cilia- and flagella-associated protein 97 [Xyrichtys novacula]